MTLKTAEQWGREWNLPGIGVMVEAVRAEFAKEAAVQIRAMKGESLAYAARIVEALARPAHPKCHADCTYECCNHPEITNGSPAACMHDYQNGWRDTCLRCGARL